MKKVFFLLLLLPFAALAQPGKKDITHTVGPKESLSSIGRLYNINGRELANYNKIDYEKGLTIGQVLKIPAPNANAAAVPPPPPVKNEVKTEPVTKPVAVTAVKGGAIYHTVEKKQTLYAVSKLYGVTVDEIKKWNNLSADGLSEGAKIIVGYNGEKNNAVTKAAPAVIPPVVKPADKPVVEVPKPKKEDSPRIITKEDAMADVPVAPVKKDAPPAAVVKASNYNGGIFKADYDVQAKTNHLITENGTGGIFKSSSGWEDGKYYCLHNIAPAGTIIKVINNANGKTVYAKVLDGIPDIKQNSGLIIRLSNAAADVLGITDNKLDCTLNYSR